MPCKAKAAPATVSWSLVCKPLDFAKMAVWEGRQADMTTSQETCRASCEKTNGRGVPCRNAAEQFACENPDFYIIDPLGGADETDFYTYLDDAFGIDFFSFRASSAGRCCA